MNKYFALALSIANVACIVVNIINQKWDVMTLNIIACAICFANFIVND